MIHNPPIAQGTTGRIYVRSVGGRRIYAGRISAWHVVISPNTGKPTMIATTTIGRYWLHHPPRAALAVVQPDPPHAYIGRPKPPPATPMEITGVASTWRQEQIILSEGSIEYLP